MLPSIVVYNYSFHICLFRAFPDKKRARVKTKKRRRFKSRCPQYPMSNYKKKIETKNQRLMLYQTTCLLVVGSPSFWNALADSSSSESFLTRALLNLCLVMLKKVWKDFKENLFFFLIIFLF